MFSEPAVGERFFGRKEVLEILNKRVSALKDGYRQNVALTGQSLSGKSSILHHFLHTLREENIVPVYVEVVKEPFGSFANKFIATLLYNTLRGMGEDTGIEFDSILEKAKESLPRTYAASKHIFSNIERANFDEAYAALLGLTSVLKDETRMSCLVIFDEFDNLEHLGIKNPFLNFGKVIMVQKDTMYIVASSRGEAIKKILSEKLSLLFGNFEVVTVAGFSRATAYDFIGSKTAGFDIDDILKAFILAFTGGNAFYLDKILLRAREKAAERMTNHIDEDALGAAILELIYDSGGVIHQYLMNSLLELLDTKNKDMYLAILLSIANGRNRQLEIARSVKTKRADAVKHLARLSELGLVSKCGAFYAIDDVILEFWLKHVYQRKRNFLVGGALDRAAIFASDIRAYLADFRNETDKSDAASKVAELFDSFSNDLVCLDSRSARLPHFTRVEKRSFGEKRPFVAASVRGKYWIAQPYGDVVGENDVIEFIRNAKSLGCKISNKLIIPLAGMDENAKLLAKELKIAIWDLATINTLLTFYGKKRIVLL
ncbi:MAG: ATP-binding protein [Candidatus Omnitrophota bacterium]